MAETTQKTNQRKAKGTRNNGKPGRPEPRRPRATAKVIRKRKKAPPAKAAKKQAAAARADKDAAALDQAEQRGIDMLQDEVNTLLKANPGGFAKRLMKQSLNGKPTSLKTFVELARGTVREKVPIRPRRDLTERLEQIAKEMEFEMMTKPEPEVSQPADNLEETQQAALAA